MCWERAREERGAHRTSNILMSDVSWVGTRERLCEGQELVVLGWGQEEDDKEDLLHTLYCCVLFVV